MTGTEVENLAAASLEGAAGTEYFPAGEPGDKQQFIRFRNQEMFAIGFFVFQNDLFVDALCKIYRKRKKNV